MTPTKEMPKSVQFALLCALMASHALKLVLRRFFDINVQCYGDKVMVARKPDREGVEPICAA